MTRISLLHFSLVKLSVLFMFQLSFSSTHNPSAATATLPLTPAHHHPPPFPFWLAPLSLCLARLSLPTTSPPIVHDERRIGEGVYARRLRAGAATSFSSKISLGLLCLLLLYSKEL
ncbi:PREDICTED: uncharacterized protein LOC105973879 [Erythranthe guttata]|uniref:uncharacterized protein LOC105973879 n=1 Tax=Erythranthe guttata TaxID=4155 RepID=UPI00064D7CDD|nr:PREDICTED: uncharacterized protein LOC105973879 [Erythranthe guttata]|eukprot:XP_012854376.1 PREDICTED: uncharacterized protein LOC105973879 [Erythranthe guttata]